MIDVCRSCGRSELIERINLGSLHLSDFSDDPSYEPPEHPLRLVECEHCSLVQLDTTVDRSAMYHDRYGYVSGANKGIVEDLRSVAATAMDFRTRHGLTDTLGASWLDIASNDGTLLSAVPKTFIRVGVDPVEKFAAGARAHANRIIPDYFHPKLFSGDQFDVITSVSMFYDVHDLNEFVAGVARVLAKRGIWVIQQNYLVPMLMGGAYDNICHEHLTYFSVTALRHLLEINGLEIVEVSQSRINGGCIRTIVAHQNEFPHLEQLDSLVAWEDEHLTPERWGAFRELVTNRSQDIHDLVSEAVNEHRSLVAIYGASTRGSIIWQLADIGGMVQAAIDIQPEKAGRLYSAVGSIPIELPIQEPENDGYRVKLVGPYWHRDMFIKQEAEWMVCNQDNRLVFPLPELTTVRVQKETSFRVVEEQYEGER